MNVMYTDYRKTSLLSADKNTLVRLLSSSILMGCNIYHSTTVIRQEVDFGKLRGKYTREAGRDFAQRFLNRFVDNNRVVPNNRINVRFLNRLNSAEGATFEEVLLEAILFVESSMAFAKYDFRAVEMAQVLDATSPCHALLIWESSVPKFSRDVARVALAGLVELLPEELHPFHHDNNEDFQSTFVALERRATQSQKSTTTSVIMSAAKKRGIPCESLGGSHLRLGDGNAQRMIYASILGNTTLVVSQLCRNKRKTIRRLAQLRLPVPEQKRVTSIEESLVAAKTLGYPVVVKPLKGKQAAGVSVGIRNSSEIPSAFERAGGAGSDVIVESFVPGDAYRLLVIGGRFVAALKILPPSVTGDGEKTIEALIEELNSDPQRNNIQLFKVDIDDELITFLDRSDYALDHVLENKKEIMLRSVANVAVGGVHTDVTDIVHPNNQEMAVRAANGIGLEVAGVDFITQDISRSYQEVGGSIIEMNARPGLCMHTFPCYGKSRNVADAMLDMSFPLGVSGLIPTALVIGDRHTASVARELDLILRLSGRITGLVMKKNSYISGQHEVLKKSQQRNAIRIMLRDPRIETLVSTLSQRRAINRGLLLETVDVAAIMNPVADGDSRIYQQGLEVVIKATSGILVVSAGNKLALKVLDTLDSKRLILVSPNLLDPAIDVHLAAGGTAVVAVHEQEQDWAVFLRKDESVAKIPIAKNNASEKIGTRRMETRMFAVALAFGMGLSGEQIKALITP